MDVLCVGHASWDISFFLEGFPAENSKLEIRSMIECGGGPAANAAYLLARWGISSGLAASVGADAYGNRIAEELAAAGADIALLDRDPSGVTPVSAILVNQKNGSRTIINRKATGGGPLKLKSPPSLGVAPRVMLFDGHELEASLWAMELFPDALTILDAGSLREGTRELAKRVDFLVSSERFACQFSDLPDLASSENQAKAIAALSAWNGKPVVITRGERGMLRGTSENFQHYPAFSVEAIDTTAAGDIFHGAFAYGVLKGLPIEETLRLSAAAAAISVTIRGGRPSIPDLSQVREMLHHAG
jgi:sugar/nucleoside kinase (ribokinase family)